MQATYLFEPSLAGYVHYCLGFCLRYFAVAGSLFVFFHVWFRRRWAGYRIQESFPGAAEVGHEIRWSLSNAACTGLSTVLLYSLVQAERTAMYFAADERGWAWFAATVVLGVAGYDAWFYWQHRLLHTSWLFRRVHAVHHRVTNPTPFATFAHHPIETFMGNAFFLAFVMLVPVHPLALGLVGLWVFLFGIVAHLGYELGPRGFPRRRLLGWLNTATYHNLHHSLVGCNYGLCFNYWDRLLGTASAAYAPAYDAVTARRARAGFP